MTGTSLSGTCLLSSMGLLMMTILMESVRVTLNCSSPCQALSKASLHDSGARDQINKTDILVLRHKPGGIPETMVQNPWVFVIFRAPSSCRDSEPTEEEPAQTDRDYYAPVVPKRSPIAPNDP